MDPRRVIKFFNARTGHELPTCALVVNVNGMPEIWDFQCLMQICADLACPILSIKTVIYCIELFYLYHQLEI